MALPAKHPAYNDSDNVLWWKYAWNLWTLCGDAQITGLPEPKLGSSSEVLMRRAVQYLEALNGI